MFVGHGLLAFAIVAALAAAWGAERWHAVAVGLLAAGFATAPDVDVLHPIVSLLVDPVALGDVPDAFWSRSTALHRTSTHSLVVGLVTAGGITAWSARRAVWSDTVPASLAHRLAGATGIAVLTALVAAVWLVDGVLPAAIVGLLAVACLALVSVGERHGLGIAAVGAAAFVGLATHPFGDLLTGQPPPLFYPLGVDVLTARITLHPDPTLHLLGAFLVELATAWLALAVLARLFDVNLRRQVGVRAGAGVGYAGAAFVLPAPSLSAATAFVFTLLAVGLLGAPLSATRRGVRWRAATTALAAVTLAALAYGAVYVAV